MATLCPTSNLTFIKGLGSYQVLHEFPAMSIKFNAQEKKVKKSPNGGFRHGLLFPVRHLMPPKRE